MENCDEPDRNDIAEVSKATLEGADCFILTHETSIWPLPVEAITYCAKGIAEAEAIFNYEQAFINVQEEIKTKAEKTSIMEMITNAGCGMALDNDIDLYVCLTNTGRMA